MLCICIAALATAFAGLWLFGMLVMLDLSIPSEKLSHYQRVLIIFPHADDEVLHAGGLIKQVRKCGGSVIYAILTKGERGTPDAHRDDALKSIRTAEAEVMSHILCVDKLIQEDFGDLQLVNKKPALREYLRKVIDDTQPMLIVTYDQAGLYGHPDHIACSEVVTALVRDEFPNIHLWYPAFPARVYRMVKLPEHMAANPSFKDKRAVPKLKVFVFPHLMAIIKTAGCYKSQAATSRVVPIPFLPMWFFYSMIMYEYFENVI